MSEKVLDTLNANRMTDEVLHGAAFAPESVTFE